MSNYECLTGIDSVQRLRSPTRDMGCRSSDVRAIGAEELQHPPDRVQDPEIANCWKHRSTGF
eukprot:scaffold429547_cov34-Prasinocladus_malaysianus.AAC.1